METSVGILLFVFPAFLLLWDRRQKHVLWVTLILFVGRVVFFWDLSDPLAVMGLVIDSSIMILISRRINTKMLPVRGKSVLITGCDSGFGHELAKMMHRAGMKVYAGVLNEFGPGAEELRNVLSPNLIVIQLDVTDINQIMAAHNLIKSQTGRTGLWGLVNNAGVLGYMCDGEIFPMRLLRKILNVNFIAAVELTQVFLPMLREARGRIINISCIKGEVPFPRFAAYGASKAALTLYSGALRQELSCWGVKVAIVQPGAFRTNILGNREEWSNIQQEVLNTLPQEVMEAYGEEYIRSMQQRLGMISTGSFNDITPVLEAIQHALLSEKPNSFYYPGKGAWAIPFEYRIFPTRLVDAVFSLLFIQSGIQPAVVARQ